MKTTFAVFLLLIGFSFSLFSQTIDESKNAPFIPLKLENYWVYINSKHPDKLDTIRIKEVQKRGEELVFGYFGQEIIERNDTIYEIQSARGGGGVHSFLARKYFPAAKDMEYRISIGGDVGGSIIIKKIKGSYSVQGKDYFNCYEFSQNTEKGIYTVVIAWGIGIIETKTANGTLSLIKYKVE